MPRTGLTAEEIKGRAVEETVALMREVGFEKVRLSDVARRLDVSHAALYIHFADKEALLDAVSDHWLRHIDETQEAICHQAKPASERIEAWFLNLHRLKRRRFLDDPELYRAFDFAAEKKKAFVKRHLQTAHRQLRDLVQQAMGEGSIAEQDAGRVSQILFEAMAAFHHPKMVVAHIEEKRETLLHDTFRLLLRGLSVQTIPPLTRRT